MFGVGLRGGERFAPRRLARASRSRWPGLVYLVPPGLAAPAPLGTALMAIGRRGLGRVLAARPRAGRAGGRHGRQLRARDTAGADAERCCSAALGSRRRARPGAGRRVRRDHLRAWATSLWYAALPGSRPLRAATVQLSVPPLTALAGVLLLARSAHACGSRSPRPRSSAASRWCWPAVRARREAARACTDSTALGAWCKMPPLMSAATQETAPHGRTHPRSHARAVQPLRRAQRLDHADRGRAQHQPRQPLLPLPGQGRADQPALRPLRDAR